MRALISEERASAAMPAVTFSTVCLSGLEGARMAPGPRWLPAGGGAGAPSSDANALRAFWMLSTTDLKSATSERLSPIELFSITSMRVSNLCKRDCV